MLEIYKMFIKCFRGLKTTNVNPIYLYLKKYIKLLTEVEKVHLNSYGQKFMSI